MTELTFSELNRKIPLDEYFRILAWLDKTLAVGVELERPCSATHDILARKLNTTIGKQSSLSIFKQAPCNEYNVAYLYGDASVRANNGASGVEVVFGGTLESFNYIRQRLAMIEAVLDKNGCDDYNSSCSNHITLISLQDRLISPIVLKNILQITRAFSAGLMWLCGGENGRISRPSIGRYADPLIGFTPLEKNLNELVACGKFKLCNMSKQAVFRTGTQEDDLMMSGLFVEFRNPDGFRVPSALASLMMMYKALIYKAVELSTKGALNVDSFESWSDNKALTRKIMVTQPLTELEVERIKSIAEKFIAFIGPQLKTLSPDASEIIKQMADKPVGMRYRKNDATYRTIEKELSGSRTDSSLSDKEQRILEFVMSGKIKAASPSLYRVELAHRLDVSERMVEYLMQRIREKTDRELVYDSESKCYQIE